MTGQEIITKFETYMDDMSELSSDEELDLLNKIYQKVCADRPWEFTKKAYSGTVSGTTLALPSDFSYLTQNYNYSENNIDSRRPVIFVNSSPYEVVSWSDRTQYANRANIAYIDIRNSNLVFTVAPTTGATVAYDYHAVPSDLTTGTSPIFPARFHDVLYHGMCIDGNVIQMSDKAKSYLPENRAMYDDYIKDMAFWNANLVQQ